MSRCPKCHGLLYPERLSAGDCQEAFGIWLYACVNCGLRMDNTIHRHKTEPPKSRIAAPILASTYA